MRRDHPVTVPTAPAGVSGRALDLWVAETQGRTRSVGRRLLPERVAFVRLAKLLRLEWEFDVDGGRW
jgi:hypothetical protein